MFKVKFGDNPFSDIVWVKILLYLCFCIFFLSYHKTFSEGLQGFCIYKWVVSQETRCLWNGNVDLLWKPWSSKLIWLEKRPLTIKLEKEIIKEIANSGPHERKSVTLSRDCTRNTFLVQFKNNKSFIIGSIFPVTSVARTGGQFFSFFSTRLCFSWWYTVCTQYVHQQLIFEWGRCSY